MWALTNKNMTWKQKRLGKKIIKYCKKHNISLEPVKEPTPTRSRIGYIKVYYYKDKENNPKPIGSCIFSEEEVYTRAEKVYEMLFSSIQRYHEKHVNGEINHLDELCKSL